MITLDVLNKKLVELKRQLKMLEHNYYQCTGAILTTEKQIKQIKNKEDVEITD